MNNSIRNAVANAVQSLESRRLLASSLSNGVLTVAGDGGDNLINVARFELGVAEVVVTIDGVEERFNQDDVTSLIVNAGDGDDTISVGQITAFERTVNGEGGADRITGSISFDSLNGGAGDDSIDAGKGGDVLEGGDGNDTLNGQGDDDSIDGGAGADVINGGSASFLGDTLSYESRNDDLSITMDNLADDGETGEGDNVSDIEDLIGGAGNDLIVGNSSGNRLSGGAGDDTLMGNGGIDILSGSDGSDSLDGGSQKDIIRGGRGNDTLEGNGGEDSLFGQGGRDLIDGGSDSDFLDGGISPDTLFGRGGNDGLAAHDVSSSGPASAADSLEGGGGQDRLNYSRAGAGVTITLDGVANDGVAGENDNIGADIEDFDLTTFDDNISLAGVRGKHRVQTVEGHDTIVGGLGADILLGDAGNDSIDGGGAEDRIFGGTGDDILIAADGLRDLVNGGPGDDAADVDSGVDSVIDVETVT